MAYTLEPVSKNILKIEFIGDITNEDAQENSAEIDELLEKATPSHPIHFLVDASRMGKVSSGARRVFTQRNQNPRIGSTALVGMNRAIRVLAIFIAKASGREDNMRFFDSEESALEWLKSLP